MSDPNEVTNEELQVKLTQFKCLVEEDLHTRFKTACTKNKITMRECISRFMEMIATKNERSRGE